MFHVPFDAAPQFLKKLAPLLYYFFVHHDFERFFSFVLFEVEDSIDQGITTPSPMLSALPDSPSPPGFNESSAMSQSMWSDEIEYVDLEKEDRGLGFSILDYKVNHNPKTRKTVLVRGAHYKNSRQILYCTIMKYSTTNSTT